MVMSWIFTGMAAVALFFAIIFGNGEALAASVTQGAQSGITLVISMAGAVCLWTGVAKVMEKAGIMNGLSRLLRPILHCLFPSTKSDSKLAGNLSANICANLLGLGNAATPMGIQAAQRLAAKNNSGVAGDELCRMVVLNTASIQLIPATVAAVRSSLGCVSPFDILPAVWITSFCSATAGLLAAWCLGKLWRR